VSLANADPGQNDADHHGRNNEQHDQACHLALQRRAFMGSAESGTDDFTVKSFSPRVNDAQSGAAVISLLFELNREYGTTLVLVTHDEALAARCARTLRLAGGRVAA